MKLDYLALRRRERVKVQHCVVIKVPQRPEGDDRAECAVPVSGGVILPSAPGPHITQDSRCPAQTSLGVRRMRTAPQ